MKSILAALVMTTAMTLPVVAQARPVMLTVNMAQYGGPGAYLAIYVTNPKGAYVSSLWMAGGRTRYYRHLSEWSRLTGGDPAAVNGITGASVGPGQSLNVSVDLADSIFDAGYTLHVDAAAEQMYESPKEIALPLTAAGAGKPVNGRGYIDTFQYAF